MDLLSLLKASPLLFDTVKRISRFAGVSTRLYRRLSLEPTLQRSVKFIQIGANDGISYDPIREFVIKHRWAGIVIEPIPHICEILRRNYRAYPAVKALNCAIGYGREKTLRIYGLGDEALARLPEHASFVSSIDCMHLQREFPSIRSQDIVETTVDAMTLEEVAERYNMSTVELLAIDAEGSEANILLNFDLSKLKPQIILYENVHILPADRDLVEGRLMADGYRLEHYGNDTLAVKRCPAT